MPAGNILNVCFIILYIQVGFCAAHIIYEGQTVVMMAVRLHRDYEGKGLYGYLDKNISESARSRFVSVKTFTTSTKNPNIIEQSFQDVNKLILSKVLKRKGGHFIEMFASPINSGLL